IEAGALDHAIGIAYYDAIQETKLVPVDHPKVEVTDFTAPAEGAAGDTKVATFTVEVDVLPEVTLKNYKKIKVKAPKQEAVADADVEEVVEGLRKQRANLKATDKKAVAAKGMWADIGFDGSVD